MKNSLQIVKTAIEPMLELYKQLEYDIKLAQLTADLANSMRRMIIERHTQLTGIVMKVDVGWIRNFSDSDCVEANSCIASDYTEAAAGFRVYHIPDDGMLNTLVKYIAGYGFWLEPSEREIDVFTLRFKD